MSVDFIAKAKDVKMPINSVGRDLCGHINRQASAPVWFSSGDLEGERPLPPYKALAGQAKNWAERIRSNILGDLPLSPEKLKRLHATGLFDGTMEELKKFVGEYAKFLEKCGGYKIE